MSMSTPEPDERPLAVLAQQIVAAEAALAALREEHTLPTDDQDQRADVPDAEPGTSPDRPWWRRLPGVH